MDYLIGKLPDQTELRSSDRADQTRC